MKKVLFLGLLLCLGATGSHSQGPVKDVPRKEFPRKPFPWEIGGGEVPIPYAFILEKYELAPDENYVLAGIVDYSYEEDAFVLKVDLELQPWLSTKKRKKNPAYLLRWDHGDLEYYVGKTVRVDVTAKWKSKKPLKNPQVELLIQGMPMQLDLNLERACQRDLNHMRGGLKSSDR